MRLRVRHISVVMVAAVSGAILHQPEAQAVSMFSIGATGGYHRLDFNGSKKGFFTTGGRVSLGPFSGVMQLGFDGNYFLKKDVVSGSSYGNFQMAPWIGAIFMRGKSAFNPYLRAGFSFNKSKSCFTSACYSKNSNGFGFTGGAEVMVGAKGGSGAAIILEGGYQLFKAGNDISWNGKVNPYIKDFFFQTGLAYHF